MTKFFKIVEKSHFGVIFAQIGFFFKRTTHNSTGSPNPMLNITKKVMCIFQENLNPWKDRRMDRRMDKKMNRRMEEKMD